MNTAWRTSLMAPSCQAEFLLTTGSILISQKSAASDAAGEKEVLNTALFL
jgi:hypothetical protein